LICKLFYLFKSQLFYRKYKNRFFIIFFKTMLN